MGMTLKRCRISIMLVIVGAAITSVGACSSSESRTGAAESVAAQPVAANACSLAAPEELGQAIGKPIATAQEGTPDGPVGCTYRSADDSSAGGWVQVTVYDRRAAFDQRRSSQCKTSEARSEDALRPSKIRGLGMEALDCGPDLFVLVDAERGFVVGTSSDISSTDREAIGRLFAPHVVAMP